MNDWYNKYLSPVGDSYGKTRVLLFNPSSNGIRVKMDYLNSQGWKRTASYYISGGSTKYTDVIPTGSGAYLYSTNDEDFMALSMTDTEGSGQIFDWGFPVVPTKLLSPEVVIGFAFGCTDLECKASGYTHVRSLIWLTPSENCDVYLDNDNDGTVDAKGSNIKYLQSIKIKDENDKDMSGARIWATKPGSGPDGERVLISAAYGQDPMRSFNTDTSGLDLGTVILPFQGIQAEKTAELIDDADSSGDISPGDTLLYSINVWNVGQTDIPAGSIRIKDTLDASVDYVPSSMKYNTDKGETQVVGDDNSGTAFALDGNGITSRYQLDRRGGAKHTVSFKVKIKDSASDQVVNNGSVTYGSKDIPFELITKVNVKPAIQITKTVYRGQQGEAGCKDGKKTVAGLKFDKVTYCFSVTNTGSTYLDDVKIVDQPLQFDNLVGFLAPGESKTLILESDIEDTLSSEAIANGSPTNSDKEKLCGVDDVEDKDAAGVTMIQPTSASKMLCK